MRIADGVVEDIRERTDIVELVREYVPGLKMAGRSQKACCPFHQERTPSFNVNPEKQFYHCFGCGASGDAFSFVMRLEGLSFPEAVVKLGERVGVKVAPSERELSPAERDRMAVRRSLEAARDHYRRQLKASPEADEARRTLARRGVSPAMAEQFGLGYAPRQGGAAAALTKAGFGTAILERAGLVVNREGRLREMFWSRLLFPIRNGKGETVGFGGRVLGDGEPKYLNTAETELFSKGKVLYGLHEALAALRKERKALVLEGYMDVIGAHQFGFTNAVAPLGTALTEDHAALLKRWAESVVIVFDPDAAGAAAAVKGAELLLEKGFSVSVATVPEGLDPDEFLHKRGAPAFSAALDAAEDLASFKTRVLLKGRGALAPEEKARIAGVVLDTIRRCPDEVLKGEWVRRLSQTLSLDEGSLHRQLAKGPAEAAQRRRPAPGAPAAGPKALSPADRDVLLALLHAPALAGQGLVDESDFSDPRAKAIFLHLRETGPGPRLLEGLPEDCATLAREILCDNREVPDPAQRVAEVVGRTRRERRLKELEPIFMAAIAEGKVDPDLKAEYQRLRAELQGTRKGA